MVYKPSLHAAFVVSDCLRFLVVKLGLEKKIKYVHRIIISTQQFANVIIKIIFAP